MNNASSVSGDQIIWVAGETSGDMIAGPALAALNASMPGVRHAGIGGPDMRAAGMDCWWDIADLSVRGYTEVLTALPRLLRMRSKLAKRVLADPPALFVGVDAPDFNFALAKRLRQRGVRTAHLVGPSVWAWRASRLKTIRESVDHMMLLFPFEKPLYDEAGIPASYVGHPLADRIAAMDHDKAAARRRLGLISDERVITLMPGSRGSEIRYMGKTFLETARWLFSKRHDIQFVLPAANHKILTELRNEAAAMGMADSPHLHLAGTSYRLMKRMGYLPYVGLPNILCNDWIVPEYIQDAATAPALGTALLAQLDDQSATSRIVERFQDLKHELAVGCAERVSEVVSELVGAGR